MRFSGLVNPDGYELPFHLDTINTSAAAVTDLSHLWTVQHAAWDKGKMDSWLPPHRAADGNTNGPMTMGSYTRADLPFHYALSAPRTGRRAFTQMGQRRRRYAGVSCGRRASTLLGSGRLAG